jgi:outer membrane biosynthesis protein TonB
MWNTKKFIKSYFLLIAPVLVLLIVGVSYVSAQTKEKEKEGLGSSTPANTPIPTKALTPTPTPAKALTPSPTPTKAVTPTPTPTKAVTPTTTPTKTVTPTPTPTKAVTPTPTPTKAVTPTPTPTKTVTTTPTPTPTKGVTTAPTIILTPTTKKLITTTSTPIKAFTPIPGTTQVKAFTSTPSLTPFSSDPSAMALQNVKNILQNVGPFPDPTEFDTYRFNNPCKILVNLKPIGNAPPPSKTLAPSRAVTSFQEVINKLVEACIAAETKNDSSHYMMVSQLTIGYTMYLKKILDNIKAVDTTKPANVTQLAYILRNNLLTYTDNNSSYYIPLDVMITYINSHLNFLINSGVYNPTDTPDFICNFDNLSVAQYGYIQNFTINILQYMGAVVDIKAPLDNSTKAKLTTDMPRSIMLLQTLNNNDTKNMKLLG